MHGCTITFSVHLNIHSENGDSIRVTQYFRSDGDLHKLWFWKLDFKRGSQFTI